MAAGQLQLQLAEKRVEPAHSPAQGRATVANPPGIHIGTCGFSYKEWIGPYYPPRTRMGDMLCYYAREFDCVEINSSFYGVPSPETTLRFARITPADFQFIMKANQAMTHEVDPSRNVFDEFQRALAPLARAGKLACVLAQFPQRFHREEANLDYLREFRQRMPDYCVVVEFRHTSWNEAETFALLDELGLHYCCVDEPALPGLMPQVKTMTGERCPQGRLAYVRFHGRNARQWHRHEHAWMRYDYLYEDEELRPWADWVAAARSAHADTRIFTLFNNHAQAQAVQDARRMRRLLQQSGEP